MKQGQGHLDCFFLVSWLQTPFTGFLPKTRLQKRAILSLLHTQGCIALLQALQTLAGGHPTGPKRRRGEVLPPRPLSSLLPP